MPVLHFSSDRALLHKEIVGGRGGEEKREKKGGDCIPWPQKSIQVITGHNVDDTLFPTRMLQLRCLFGKLHSGL